MPSRNEAETKVRSWGFGHVFTWTDGPYDCNHKACLLPIVGADESNDSNAHYPPHRHSGLTTHLILSGELTITYPEDEDSKKETFGPGARIDVGAKKLHEVWMGRVGCTYVIGE